MFDDGSTPLGVALPWVARVLDFWFRELGEECWFTASSDLDERVRRRFLAVRERIIASDDCSLAGPRPLLAWIVVLDQFSRNMFRGIPRAFAADPVARTILARPDVPVFGLREAWTPRRRNRHARESAVRVRRLGGGRWR